MFDIDISITKLNVNRINNPMKSQKRKKKELKPKLQAPCTQI